MTDPESSNSEARQPEPDDKQRRESWWSFSLDLMLGFGDTVGWLIGGVARAVAWIAAAVLSSCN